MSGSDIGPFDPDELVLWAENYGHPEGWAKRAQQAHADSERLRTALYEIVDVTEKHVLEGWMAPGECATCDAARLATAALDPVAERAARVVCVACGERYLSDQFKAGGLCPATHCDGVLADACMGQVPTRKHAFLCVACDATVIVAEERIADTVECPHCGYTNVDGEMGHAYEDKSGGYQGSESHVTGRNLDGPMG